MLTPRLSLSQIGFDEDTLLCVLEHCRDSPELIKTLELPERLFGGERSIQIYASIKCESASTRAMLVLFVDLFDGSFQALFFHDSNSVINGFVMSRRYDNMDAFLNDVDALFYLECLC